MTESERCPAESRGLCAEPWCDGTVKRRHVVRVERPNDPSRVTLRVSTAEATGEGLRATWTGKERPPDDIQLNLPRWR